MGRGRRRRRGLRCSLIVLQWLIWDGGVGEGIQYLAEIDAVIGMMGRQYMP